jgi:hypothetical protein
VPVVVPSFIRQQRTKSIAMNVLKESSEKNQPNENADSENVKGRYI